MKRYHPFISDNIAMIHNGHQSSSSPILQRFIPQLYTNLIEMVHDAVIVCDLKQHILLWNKSAEQLYKWGQQEVQGQVYHELLQSELLGASEKNILTLSKQDHWEGDLQQVCRDGTNVIVKSRQTIVSNPDNKSKVILITNQNITEQTRIDQELKKQLHLISIAREIGFWSWDINNDQITTFLDAPNNARGNAYTYAQFLQLIDAEDRERVDTIIQDALKNGVDYNFEYRCIAEPTHMARWINVLGRVIYNEQGQPAYSIGISTNVTDQRNLEAALKETNHHLQVVLETMSGGLYFLDNHWRFTYVSRRAEEILQRSQESLLGKNLWEEMAQLRGTQFEQKLLEAVETQTTIQFDHVSSIDKHWYEVRLYPSAEGILIYCHDITEYRSTKNALQASEAKVALLLETNIISMCISDNTGKVHKANDTYLSMLGFTQTDLAEGKINWIEQTPPEYREYDRKCVHDTRNNGTSKAYEKEIYNKQGQIVPILVVGRTIDADNGMFTALIVDITAQKQLEKQKETFMSIVGHELRTPLTAINGSIQLVQRRLKRFVQERPEDFEPETQAMFEKLNKLLEQSLRQARVQNRLINDMLDISRLAIDKLELTMQTQDLVHLVRETVKDLRYTAGNREINLKLPEQQTILVQADGDRIGQVLSNYITNALKYTDPSEAVTIEVTLDTNEARVWVHDKGPGLSEEDQTRIWESYYRTSNANDQQGTGINLGLGLHICQILIQRHEGQVGVVSKEKEGSSFWFSLPTTYVRIG